MGFRLLGRAAVTVFAIVFGSISFVFVYSSFFLGVYTVR